MIYIIDHQDSFTWNVVHQFAKFDKVHCSDYFDINEIMLYYLALSMSLLTLYTGFHYLFYNFKQLKTLLAYES